VADTGAGISEDVQAHIFEPFFTTKPTGQGTGLGLAMVFGAVQQNGGFIVVHSEKGQGTCFDLYFPRYPGEAREPAVQPSTASMPTGNEHILLVEDDAAVRSLGERILAQLGYQVVACATGNDAMATGQHSGTAFDLLIVDVILPDIDGQKVAGQLVAKHPSLRVLYCSGYNEDVIAHHGVVDERLAFLPKPFTAEALAHKVRSVLDEPMARAQTG